MFRLAIALAMLIIGPLAFGESLIKRCPVDTDFLCLIRNTAETHAESNERWWKMYRLGCRKAWKCASSRDVATYLTIWSVDGLDGDLSEGVTEDTENLLIWKPTCFFEGALALPPHLQDQLGKRFAPVLRPFLVTKTLREYQRYDRYRSIAASLERSAQSSLEGASQAGESYPSGFVA